VVRIVLLSLLMLSLLAGTTCVPEDEPGAGPPEPSQEAPAPEPEKRLYAFEVADINGNPARLADYRGKVLLIVNVASKCGFTKQYEGLQRLYEKYKADGFVVMGFPANNFGSQEPGTNEEIREFCTANFGVTFPVFAKISVKGEDIHPLYRYLTDKESNPQFAGEIVWNFYKFLVSRDGEVIGRYASSVEPLGRELVSDVEEALARASGSAEIAEDRAE